MSDLSVIIVNWNTRRLLVECLHSIYEHGAGVDFDVWVVDNASEDDSVDVIRSAFPKINLIRNESNEGFARANNRAMRASRGRYMLLLNSDAMATSGALQALINLAEAQPRAGIIGAQLAHPDGSFQASYAPFPVLWQEFLILTGLGRMLFGRWYPSRGPEIVKGPQQVDYVPGACLLVRRIAYDQVGGLDENYFMYAEEVDWCYCMKRAGWQVWYQPVARILHHGGASSHQRQPQREADLYRSRVRFFRKHRGNRAAVSLKAMILGITTAKILVHGILRRISRGNCGRPTIGMLKLIDSLRGV